MPTSIEDVVADVRRMEPHEAAWVARAWQTWAPIGTIFELPGVILLRSQGHGARLDGYVQTLLEQERERLGMWDSDLAGLGHPFWEAVRSMTVAIGFRCSAVDDRRARTPYLAGKWLALWLRNVDPLVSDVAEGVIGAWGPVGSPADFISCLGPLAMDLNRE